MYLHTFSNATHSATSPASPSTSMSSVKLLISASLSYLILSVADVRLEGGKVDTAGQGWGSNQSQTKMRSYQERERGLYYPGSFGGRDFIGIAMLFADVGYPAMCLCRI